MRSETETIVNFVAIIFTAAVISAAIYFYFFVSNSEPETTYTIEPVAPLEETDDSDNWDTPPNPKG